MAYRILYIEDLKPGSIVHELHQKGFEVTHHNPVRFEQTINEVKNYDLLLFDFRLTESKAIFDAPTIAQTLRTINSDNHLDVPMVLISSEQKISDYYKDLTSQDLFDISCSKQELLSDLNKYSKLFNSLINGYQTIKKEKFNVYKIIHLPEEEHEKLDYRVYENLKKDMFKDDVYAFSSFVLNNIIKIIGPLIGEDVLSARLGVSKSSKDWEELLLNFKDFKYKGIFSDSYKRWWSIGLIEWWKGKNDGKNTLRKLNAEQRLKRIAEITGLSLSIQKPSKYAKSTSYWTICKETQVPIDPIDGLELYQRELLPWQEKEYLSIQAGLEPTKYDQATGKPVYHKFLKPIEKNRLKSIAQTL